MESIMLSFTRCMSFENGVSEEFAASMTKWLENEGVLDYAILRETYAEPRPAFHVVAGVANDA